MVGMVSASFNDELDVAFDEFLDHSDIYESYSWSPEGFGSPPSGHWRMANGNVIRIENMSDEHLEAAKKHMFKLFGSQAVIWQIYHDLGNEQCRRIKNESKDWDE